MALRNRELHARNDDDDDSVVVAVKSPGASIYDQSVAIN